MKKLLPLLALLALLPGCGVRRFTQNPDGSRELRSATFMLWGKVNEVQMTEKTFKLGSASSGTEAEKLAPLVEAIVKGAVAGASPAP